MSSPEIVQVLMFSDNYAYLIHDPATGATAAIDPADPDAVKRAADARGWTVSHILNTHHHSDHAGGNLALKAATGATVIAGAVDRDRTPGVDETVADGDTVMLGETEVRVLHVPGHTDGHVAYLVPAAKAVFCGDTLFSLGCGRMFEGTHARFWDSLVKLRALPDDTAVYCAHEYTLTNVEFALSLAEDNPAVRAREDEVRALRRAGKPTVPSSLGMEKRANPFLRADDPALAAAVGLNGASPAEVFAEVRKRKDAF